MNDLAQGPISSSCQWQWGSNLGPSDQQSNTLSNGLFLHVLALTPILKIYFCMLCFMRTKFYGRSLQCQSSKTVCRFSKRKSSDRGFCALQYLHHQQHLCFPDSFQVIAHTFTIHTNYKFQSMIMSTCKHLYLLCLSDVEEKMHRLL